jgi:hypothetical protein
MFSFADVFGINTEESSHRSPASSCLEPRRPVQVQEEAFEGLLSQRDAWWLE